jgi:hypothetical protein
MDTTFAHNFGALHAVLALFVLVRIGGWLVSLAKEDKGMLG